MEVSVDVVHARVRKRMVMILYICKKGGCWNTMHVLLIHLILFIELFVYISYGFIVGVGVAYRSR